MVRIAGLLGLALLGGCALVTTDDRPAEYYAALGSAGADQLSLVAADAEILPDEDLARLLAHEYEPPPLSRVALLPFAWDIRSSWSQDLARAAAVVDARVVETLEAAPGIFDASYLPSMLVPEKRTVPYLREAAARYQADLLLTFSSTCRTFQGARAFQPDEARAYCRVDAALLDVRTGLVPFAADSTQTIDATESEDDVVTAEAGLRAEVDAIAAALAEITDALVAYLGPAEATR